MMKLQFSGYSQVFRYEIAKSAIHAYERIREDDERGIRPLHRPKNWRRTERKREKENKMKNWYKQGGFDSVLFVPTTKNGKLRRMYQHVIQNSGIRMRVVERTGRTLKSQLQTSNPFKRRICGRENCFVCTTTGKGNCETESVTYKARTPGNCEQCCQSSRFFARFCRFCTQVFWLNQEQFTSGLS